MARTEEPPVLKAFKDHIADLSSVNRREVIAKFKALLSDIEQKREADAAYQACDSRSIAELEKYLADRKAYEVKKAERAAKAKATREKNKTAKK